ncbi:hypothetical protein RR48_00913, partial [Papilio machaon]
EDKEGASVPGCEGREVKVAVRNVGKTPARRIRKEHQSQDARDRSEGSCEERREDASWDQE